MQHLLGKLEGKKLPGRSQQRWKDNNKMHFKETGWKGIGWINLAQDMDKWQGLVIKVTNHSSPTKCREYFDYFWNCCFSRRTLLHLVS